MNADDRARRPLRYRFRTAALVGPWRQTRGTALRDARKARQADADETEPDGVRWRVPGMIEEDGPVGENEAARRSVQPGEDR